MTWFVNFSDGRYLWIMFLWSLKVKMNRVLTWFRGLFDWDLKVDRDTPGVYLFLEVK